MNHTNAASPTRRRLWAFLLPALFLTVAACSEDAGVLMPEPVEDPVPIGVVLASVDISLTVFPVDSPTVTRTVGLGPAGTPVGFAIRGETAAIPMGTAPAVAVVDLGTESVTHTIGLPQGSGATGIAFVNDSIALVANPGLNSVTSVNVNSGTAGQTVDVGVYPTAVAAVGTRAFVVNANLVNFAPTGPGTVTVLDAGSLNTVSTITLSGVNPGSIAVGPDGNVYVMNSGNFAAGDGSLSVIDPNSMIEIAHHTGFGDFPSPMAFGPDGTLYAASFSYGISAWNSGTRTFSRAPDQAIQPNGTPSASGVGVDANGQLYGLAPTCGGPSQAHRLDSSFAVDVSIPTGACPTAIHFGVRGGS